MCVAITNCTWIYPNVFSNKCKRSTDEAILIIIDVHRYQYCILADQFKMRELFNWLDMRGGKTRTTRMPAFWDTAPWLPRFQDKTRQSQSYKFKKIAENPNFEISQETLHATHLLKLLDKMSKSEMDPTRTVGSTERTLNVGRTDGRTYWQMNRRTEWNQYTPQQLFCAEGMIIFLQETHSPGGGTPYVMGDTYVPRFWPPFFTLAGSSTIFLGYFSHPPTAKLSFGVQKLPIFTKIDLFGPKFNFFLDLFGSNFQRPAAHPHQFSGRVPPPGPFYWGDRTIMENTLVWAGIYVSWDQYQ